VFVAACITDTGAERIAWEFRPFDHLWAVVPEWLRLSIGIADVIDVLAHPIRRTAGRSLENSGGFARLCQIMEKLMTTLLALPLLCRASLQDGVVFEKKTNNYRLKFVLADIYHLLAGVVCRRVEQSRATLRCRRIRFVDAAVGRVGFCLSSGRCTFSMARRLAHCTRVCDGDGAVSWPGVSRAAEFPVSWTPVLAHGAAPLA
jgi:hypothetical protein